MEFDLSLELVAIFEEGEGVIISLTDDFDLTGCDHATDLVDELRRPF